MFRTECISCGKGGLEEIIDLGLHPFADTFIPVDKLYLPDKFYPLVVMLCPHCKLIQLKTITTTDERYKEFDYSYTSSSSAAARKHWDAYPQEIAPYMEFVHGYTGYTLFEIGSNDGYLLKQFKSRGYAVYGCDASPFMVNLAEKNGIETTNAVFPFDVSGIYGIIIANNVLNHSNDLSLFMDGIKRMLGSSGMFVFEQPYWLCGVKAYKFDQIYHEHVSYITATAIDNLCKKVGLALVHTEIVDHHGGSIRCFVKHQNDMGYNRHTVDKMIAEEEPYLKAEYYEEWSRAIKHRRTEFLKGFYDDVCGGGMWVGVGAAAKGNTLLNYYGLNKDCIKFITDSSPHKIGKFTPGSRIPITEDSLLAGIGKASVLMLAWNLSKDLKDKLLKINPELAFVEN